MHKYGESKTTRIMMATVPHVTSGLGLRKFQADGFLLTRVYMQGLKVKKKLSLRTPWRHQNGEVVYLHSLLISAVNGDDRSA